ncbi:hypothetical protein GCM10009599_14370 [Luteococcus peritonei]
MPGALAMLGNPSLLHGMAQLRGGALQTKAQTKRQGGGLHTGLKSDAICIA